MAIKVPLQALVAILWTLPSAHALQPVDQGLQPLQVRIQEVQAHIDVLAGEFSLAVNSLPRRESLGRRLVVLIETRRALEAEVRMTKNFGSSPLLTYAQPWLPTAKQKAR